MSTVRIERIKPHIGGIVHVDKEHLLDGETIAAVRAALEDRGVLVFPRMSLTDAEQLAFTDRLGTRLNYNRKAPGSGAADEEDVYAITLDKKINAMVAEYLKGSFFWHIDGASDDVPNFAALLTARTLSTSGGQTQFVNTYAAWDDLPEDEKKSLEKLRVVHSFEWSQRHHNPTPTYDELQMWQSYPHKVHPLVWTHRSGRKSLILGSTASHIEGMNIEEGRLLLCKLMDWATQPQFIYKHDWTVGDLLIWDNTGTMHRVTHYDLDSGRMMHRTTLLGEEALV